METSKKKLPLSRYLKRFTVWFTLSIISLLLLIWLLSPVLVRWQANQQLAVYNKQISENSSIRLNPFLLQVSNHSSMDFLSYVCPSLASTGSRIRVFDIGQRSPSISDIDDNLPFRVLAPFAKDAIRVSTGCVFFIKRACFAARTD